MLGALPLLLLFAEKASGIDFTYPAQQPTTEPNDSLNIFDDRDFKKESYFFEFTKQFRDEWWILDNTTETGFGRSLETTLELIIDGVCPRQGQCSPYLGCSCDRAFRKLGRERGDQCRQWPCQVTQYIYENGAKAGRELATINSFEGMMNWVVQNIFPVIQTFLCPCNPHVYKAVYQCLLKNDAEIGEPEEIAAVRELAGLFDLKIMKNALGAWTEAFCSARGHCVEEFGELLVEFGVMLDNSLYRDHPDQCQSFRRMSPAILESYQRFIAAGQDTFSAKIGIMGYDTVKEFWCGAASCAAHLDATFNTCCVRKLHQVMNGKKLSETIQALGSLFEVFAFEERGPEVELDILEEMIKPHKLCGDLYQRKTCV